VVHLGGPVSQLLAPQRLEILRTLRPGRFAQMAVALGVHIACDRTVVQMSLSAAVAPSGTTGAPRLRNFWFAHCYSILSAIIVVYYTDWRAAAARYML